MMDDYFRKTTEADRMNQLIQLLNIGCWTPYEAKHILMGIDPGSDMWMESANYSFLPGETFLRENKDQESRKRHYEMELDYMSGFIWGNGKQPEGWISTARQFRYNIPWVQIISGSQELLKKLPKEVSDAIVCNASSDASRKPIGQGARPSKRATWVSEYVKRMMAQDLKDSKLKDFTESELAAFVSNALVDYHCENAPDARVQFDIEKHGPAKDLKVKDERTITKFAEELFADAKAASST